MKKMKMFDSLKKAFSFPMSPRRQFARLMIASVVLFAAIAIFHIYFFRRIASNEIFQAGGAQAPSGPAVNEAKLSSVLSRYAGKEQIRAAALSSVPSVAEPSN